MTDPTLEERQFAELPGEVQKRVIALVRTLVGSSQDEKRYAREACVMLSVLPAMMEPMPDLLRSLTAVVMAAEIHGRPATIVDPVTEQEESSHGS